jgi:hypothetical protein
MQASTPRPLAAVKEKGVLSGKRVERRESGAPGEFAEIENMTAEQLADFIRKQAEEVAALMQHQVEIGTVMHRPRPRSLYPC